MFAIVLFIFSVSSEMPPTGIELHRAVQNMDIPAIKKALATG